MCLKIRQYMNETEDNDDETEDSDDENEDKKNVKHSPNHITTYYILCTLHILYFGM